MNAQSPEPTASFPPRSVQIAPSRLRGWFGGLALHQRFALVGSIVSLAGMLMVGDLVSHSIETGVVRNSAISSAVYMESFIAPLTQELAHSGSFSAQTQDRMRALLNEAQLAARIRSVKIWRRDGMVVFASDPTAIGQVFPPSDDLRAALDGQLSATFDELEEAESAAERESGEPLLEVYNPIHSTLDGSVIAVTEFYLVATELKSDLRAAKANAWAMVAAVSIATFAALFGIVRAGSRTIAAQTGALAARLDQIARVSAQNAALRDRVKHAAQRVSEMNERQMRKISADLHDGPAQALALASLRLDSLMRRASVPKDDPEARALRETLDAALGDVRDLCRGLTLPELEGLSIAQVVERAIGAHERRTGRTVARRNDPQNWPDTLAPHPMLICIFRFVQEGLMNAFRHAPAAEVAVGCRQDDRDILVCVEDTGPGIAPAAQMPRGDGTGIGLAGMRERIESIGGEFRLESAAGAGVTLRLKLSLEGGA